jgi:hypothetical protein
LATRSLLAAARLSRLLVAVALVTLAVATVLGTPAFVTLGGTALALCNRLPTQPYTGRVDKSERPMISSSIVLFRCSGCGTLFEPEDGGICQSCRRLLCTNHFSPAEWWPSGSARTADGKPAGPICRDGADRGAVASHGASEG